DQMACAAIRVVCRLEAQKRLTVVPGIVIGSPASGTTRRARLLPDLPSGYAVPSTWSSMVAGSIPDASTAARAAIAARSSGRTTLLAPVLARPIGVRASEAMRASGIGAATYLLW